MANIQYIIIAIIFIGAVVFLIKKFMPSKKNVGGCGKGCGCEYTNKQIPENK